MNSNNQTRCHLHQLTNDNSKLQKQYQANEESIKHEEESDITHRGK